MHSNTISFCICICFEKQNLNSFENNFACLCRILDELFSGVFLRADLFEGFALKVLKESKEVFV